ncbi:MAG: ACT domain-containing protein [Planctomycetes bacterium]|nr:ACT domain-containing protein [Planctomycetota bacterium]
MDNDNAGRGNRAGEKKHWVFRVGVADRAGALTSIASTFSNRGISIETIVGHGTPYPGAPGGAVVTTFWCTEAEKDEIVRVVARLSKVTSLEEHPYESEALRKSSLVRVTRRLNPPDVAGRETFLTCELLGENRGVYTYFLAGSPSELDPILERFVSEGILKDMVYSIIGQ